MPDQPDYPLDPVDDSECIEHLKRCPGCDICDGLVEFYETCDNCGAWGHMDAMRGVIRGGTATVLCSVCMDKYEQNPKSVYTLPIC